jgi:hypothetical protein
MNRTYPLLVLDLCKALLDHVEASLESLDLRQSDLQLAVDIIALSPKFSAF